VRGFDFVDMGADRRTGLPPFGDVTNQDARARETTTSDRSYEPGEE